MHAPIFTFATAYYRTRWIHLPAGILVALLQRTPVLRTLLLGDMAFATGAGAVLKSTFAGAAALGVVDTLAGATTFTVNPASPINGTVGQSLSIGFAYTGTPTPPASYQLRGDLPPGMTIPGLNATGFLNDDIGTITGTPTTAGTYDFSIQGYNGPNGTGMTNNVRQPIRVIIAGSTQTAPSISTQPSAQTVTVGEKATFSVVATGSPAPTFQWRKNTTAIAGATAATFEIGSAQTGDAGDYTVVVTNAAGSVTSNVAKLTVNPASSGGPTITLHPSSVSARSGSTVALSVAATGASTYQWRRNGSVIAGATSETLVLESVSAGSAGAYTVAVSNASGTVTSTAADVAVVGTGSSRIFNLSVRTNLAEGATLIVGFATEGEKVMLVRAVGPTLGASFNVPGSHPDPRMELVPAGAATALETNEDWASTLEPIFSTVGAFPLVVGSKDAAVRRAITGGGSAVVRGTGAGVVLVEVYDSGGNGRLINVSALNRVGTGADVLISGFVVDGTVAKTLVIRAVGPKLAEFGVTGVLANPKLEIFDQANLKVAENDQWNAALLPVINRSGAAGLPLATGSNDAALVVTLNPGLYSAVVSGVGNTTGQALVEVYELP